MGYADNTLVTIDRSKAQIEKTLIKYGADNIISGMSMQHNTAFVQFEYESMPIKMNINLPNINEGKFMKTPNGKSRTRDQVFKEWEKSCRTKWRVLLLFVKAQLEAIDNEVLKAQEAFLPWILLPDGTTIADKALPHINKMIADGIKPKMLGFTK